jgi:peptide/nickel transport system substrate-binding protein
MMVASVTGCSTGRRVDLGEGAAGALVAENAGEPEQLDPH